MAILRIKRADGTWEEIPAIVGRKGDKGDKGDSLTVQNDTESNADGGNNSVTLSDGSTINIKNGKTGTNGANATINGVTALVIQGRDGIGLTQDGNVVTLHLTGGGNEAGEAATILNRSTKVNEDDTNYTTIMARGSSLNATEVAPTVTGAIYWIYE